jgi:3-deoxy-D-manno-octulosonic-acid transferase
LLVAGSTDSADEERFVLRSFLKAREQLPCRLLIAPRRTERRAELVALAEEFGLRASLRSRPADNADLLILDTLGELAHVYQYGRAAYVGGAWDGMGHNVTEPVVWGVPVAYGIRRGHFAALQKLCEEYGVGFRVADDSDLAEFWRMVLGSPERQAELREACQSLIVRQSGSFEATLAGIVRAVERAYS